MTSLNKLVKSKKLFLRSGPCVIENEKHCILIAEKLYSICNSLNLNFIFKSSFDKATLSVLSFNRMSGTSLNSISEVIESTDPDIIGLQESYNMGLKIANRFDYCYYGDDYNSTAILSKYPIEFVNEIYFR